MPPAPCLDVNRVLGRNRRGGGPLDILLIGAAARWSSAVRIAATRLGARTLHAASCGGQALHRLVGAGCRYSHVLLEPRCSDGTIDLLHGLTSGEPDAGSLVLLGGRPSRWPGVPVVRRPAALPIARALALRTTSGSAWTHRPHAAALAVSGGQAVLEARFQPIVRMSDGACVGFEALARLRHPVHGTLPPEAFVGAMEAAGRAAELTEAITRHTLAALAGPFLRRNRLAVALNVPLDLLLVPATLDRLAAACAVAGVAPARVTLELTESRPVVDLAGLAGAIGRVRAAGFGAAIDDLGPSVRHHLALLELPFSAVKLDIAVIRAMQETDGRAFLRTVIGVARSAGLAIIAEGVEDRRTWNDLRALGVDQAQGFLIGRPLPAEALGIWLTGWARQGRRPAQALRGSPVQTSR